MKLRKLLTLSFSFAMIVTPILSGLSVSYAHPSQSSVNTSDLPESHLIKGVPYVSQETAYTCHYATITMILQYYGINTTEQEVRHNSGAGFSLAYLSKPRFVISGVDTSQWVADREFIASIYGLDYKDWKAPNSLSDEECWQEYWLRIKQNISKDIPVWTWVNPLFLTSIRKSIGETFHVPEWMWDVMPDFLWDLITEIDKSPHVIVIVGYNENNQTVCFNDPGTEFLGHPEYGNYMWMNISGYKNAVNSISREVDVSYWVGVFRNISTTPLNITAVFKLALERNVERMKGNNSAYDTQWSMFEVGINALKALKKNFEPGIKNRLATIYKYKLNFPLLKFLYKSRVFLSIILPNLINLSRIETAVSQYSRIAYEKRDVSRYLWNIQFLLDDTYLSHVCRVNSLLLSLETDNWDKLASDYTIFMKKGAFLSLPRAMMLMNKMADTLDNIIAIEEAIIAGPS